MLKDQENDIGVRECPIAGSVEPKWLKMQNSVQNVGRLLGRLGRETGGNNIWFIALGVAQKTRKML